MSKRNIRTNVTRETVVGENAPLSYVGVYHSTWSKPNTVHVSGEVKSGTTTHKVELRLTEDAAVALAKRLVDELRLTPSQVGLPEVESVESDS